MDLSADKEVVLLPIHPEYANAILLGKKTVEFRKRSFRRDVGFVAIYATVPISMVIGLFKVDNIHIGTPQQIWDCFHSEGCISHAAYQKYYAGSVGAVAIRVGDVIPFQRPVHLSSVASVAAPPQSFAYLGDQACDKLRCVAQRSNQSTLAHMSQ